MDTEKDQIRAYKRAEESGRVYKDMYLDMQIFEMLDILGIVLHKYGVGRIAKVIGRRYPELICIHKHKKN